MSKNRKKKKTFKKPEPASNIWFEFEADDEVDLHGYAIDEALVEIEYRLKALKKGGYRSLRIIHGQPKPGHDTIHTALRRKLEFDWSPLFHTFFIEPHNLGATIVLLHE